MKTILGTLGRRIPRPTPALGVALLALLIACSGAAVAAIPSLPDGTITACYDQKTGMLRVIDTGQTCTSKENQLAWKDGIHGQVADSLHAVQADNATNASNADTVDGKNASDFYAEGSKVVDSAHADQADSATRAGDANTLDGKDSAQFADATHAHSGADITSGTVEADRIEDGAGSNLDADTLDGLDSTELGTAASAVKAGRLELTVPPNSSGKSGSVLDTEDFAIRGDCSIRSLPLPGGAAYILRGELDLVAKQPTSAITYTAEPYSNGESTTPSEDWGFQPGQGVNLGSTEQLVPNGTDAGNTGDSGNTYVSYFADAPSGFLEGHASLSLENTPSGPTCRFSATGLGQ